MKYDIIEDLKKIRENISTYDLLHIYHMPNGPIITPSMSLPTQNTQSNVATNTNYNSYLISNYKGKSAAGKTSLIGKNSKSTSPPFFPHI